MNQTALLFRVFRVMAFVFLAFTGILFSMGHGADSGPLLIGAFVMMAVGVRGNPKYSGFQYSLWIFAAVSVSMYYPAYFREVGSFDLKLLIVPLLQIIMFGMGTAMSFEDFVGVVKMPRAVLVGLACQFTIMPIVGITLATTFALPPEIAAGVVLIGSSPSGLASNVMAYISKANLALSITLTTVATMLAPLMTPLLMKVLASQFVPIDFWQMMWSVIKIVIIPVAGGLIFNRIAHGKYKWLDNAMPMVSMVGIGVIITIITAAGRDSLLTIGLALIAAAIIHNTGGYVLGYWSCRLLKFDEKSCRTIALEVGMQNAGLASGIALEMGKVATLGLAPAVFGPLMNITGSSLATWWRDQPTEKKGGHKTEEN